MQPPALLSTVSDMLQEGNKDKSPELTEIFNQYFNQANSGTEVNSKLEKLLEEVQPNAKPEELISEIIKTDNHQPKPNTKGYANYPFSHIRKKSRQWTPEEDQRLIEAINTKGSDNWSQIAKIVGNGRTQAQCSQRWHRVLDPKISKGNWSKEEEEKLISLVESVGTKAWTKIASKMGNRSDVQCRFRYNFLLKKADNKSDQIVPIALPQALITKNPQQNDNVNLYEHGDQ
ncbi:hypothetical protein M9Y10_029950 [Tritrichomonas musculus]|uniref:Myb-like DNA-binding domain containing protein n=1 Tax=Tritrichomonas musculus TaxID=1915356 RepID=A0ABR2KNJ6_9EUKA